MFKFFKSARGLAAYLSTDSAVKPPGKVILYYWEPYPNKVFGMRNKPLFGHFSGGDTGHISMEVQYSNGTKFYLSVWPKEIIEHISGLDDRKVIKPVNNSDCLEDDIRSERGRIPTLKIIEIDAETESKIEALIGNLQEEFKKDFDKRPEWSLINNCATFVSGILYESGVIRRKQLLISTPKYVFDSADRHEQQIDLENDKTPSYFG